MDKSDMDQEPPERPYRVSRRLRLAALIKEAGGVTKLAEAAEVPKSHISAMSSGTRNVGDDLATKLETVMHKPVGWMDESSEASPVSPAEQVTLGALPDQVSRLLASLVGLQRETAVTALRYLLDDPGDPGRVDQARQQLEYLANMPARPQESDKSRTLGGLPNEWAKSA
jgi:DNA-directed RNA polymerase sigma subunit (sigma70/sigma32)